MNDTVLAINVDIGKRAAADATGLEAKVRASMAAVLRDNWMETNDIELFRAGIGGALVDVGADSDDGKRLLASMAAFSKMNAWLAAAQAGLDVRPPEVPADTLPLFVWWREAKTK